MIYGNQDPSGMPQRCKNESGSARRPAARIYAPELRLPTATEREEMECGGSGGDGGEETCPSGCPGEREPCRGGPGRRL